MDFPLSASTTPKRTRRIAIFSASLATPQTTTFYTSTYKLAGNGVVESYEKVDRPEGNIAILRVRFGVVDADSGKSIVGEVYVHHIIGIAYPSYMFVCPDSGDYRWFAGAGNGSLSSSHPLPPGFAMVDGADSAWILVFRIENELDANINMKLMYTITYDNDVENYTTVFPLTFTLPNCDSATWNITGDSGNATVVTKSWNVTAPFTGVIILAAGHLHNGGMGLLLNDDTTNTVICKSLPTYDNGDPATGHITSMTACYNEIQVFQGDHLTLEAWYDNSIAREGVMGIMMAYIFT